MPAMLPRMPTPQSEVTLRWLARLRWLAIAAQGIALVVGWYLDTVIHSGLAVTALALGAGSNVLLQLGLHRTWAWSAARLTGGALILDVVLLTVLLAGAGGASNPFTVLYLVHITLSAVVLSSWWTAAIAALSVAGFGLLFWLPAGSRPMDEHVRMGHVPGPGFDHHLRGMWMAFVVATALTAYFVFQFTRAIALQREQIAALRESSARSARLAALTTLAAGAAHELNNPLATIAVASHEATLALADSTAWAAVREDLELIELEVERCRDILGRMAARAGSDDTEVTMPVGELCDRVRAHLGDERSARVEIAPARLSGAVRVQPGPMVQSLAALIGNALDASTAGQPVQLTVSEVGDRIELVVTDHGTGIAPDVIARVGEPFFTTKQPGRGMGLGLYLARAVFESVGGALLIDTVAGRGTRVTVTVPVDVEARVRRGSPAKR